MRSVVIDKPGSVTVRALPDPIPGAGEIVIDVRVCGFCGTDLHIFRGEYLGAYPVRPGHEAAGVVSAVGEGVTDLKVGDRVAIEPNIHCGDCAMCQSGRGNFCENWTAIGVTLPGCCAEKVLAPVGQVFSIGELPFEAGAFMEPLSCCLHGMKKIESIEDEDVLVIGAGPIGLLLLQLAKLRGACRVTVTDLREARLKLARDLGADETICVKTCGTAAPGCASTKDITAEGGRATSEAGYDTVIDASGNVGAIAQTIDLVRPGGKVLWFGVAPAGETFPIEPFRVFRKGLSIHGAFTSLGNSTDAIELLAGARLQVAPLISHRLSIDEFEQAARLIEHDPDVLKIMIKI